MTTSPQTSGAISEHYIASELNFARLPFFASSTTNLKTREGITYEKTTTYEGKEINIVWEVTGTTKYGYPGPFAESVHTALLDIITEQGIPFQNPVVFSFYDICQRLDIQHNGKNIQNIRNAIFSIRLAGIIIENSFVTKDGRRISYTPDPQSLYKRIALYGSTNQETGKTMQVSAVWLSDFYLKSLNTGNIRPVDFEHFKHLHSRSYAATKLYRYLGYRFAGTFKHGNEYAKVDYDELATIADLKRQRYLSQAKQKLKRAHEALTESNFLRHIEWVQEKQNDGSNKFYIYYYPGERAHREYRDGRRSLTGQLEIPLLAGNDEQGRGEEEKVPPPSTEDSSESSELVHELEQLGVTSDRAQELVQKHTKERIVQQLDHLEYISEAGRSPDDAPAWLVSAIESNFTTPVGFKDRDEQQAKEEARARAAERKRKKLEAEEEARKEQKARHRKLDQQLAEHPEEKQEQIEQEVVRRIKANFNNFMEQIYRTGKEFHPKSPMHRAEYYEHLEDLLKEHKPSN